jgi:hypothetical protein
MQELTKSEFPLAPAYIYDVTENHLQALDNAIQNYYKTKRHTHFYNVFSDIVKFNEPLKRGYSLQFRLIEYEFKGRQNSKINNSQYIVPERKNIYPLPYPFNTINLENIDLEDMSHASSYMIAFNNVETKQIDLYIFTVNLQEIEIQGGLIGRSNIVDCNRILSCNVKGTTKDWCISCHGAPLGTEFKRQYARENERLNVPYPNLFETSRGIPAIRKYKDIYQSYKYSLIKEPFIKQEKILETKISIPKEKLKDIDKKYNTTIEIDTSPEIEIELSPQIHELLDTLESIKKTVLQRNNVEKGEYEERDHDDVIPLLLQIKGIIG